MATGSKSFPKKAKNIKNFHSFSTFGIWNRTETNMLKTADTIC